VCHVLYQSWSSFGRDAQCMQSKAEGADIRNVDASPRICDAPKAVVPEH
jgi:hypothetical protein